MKLDPTDQAIISQALVSAAREMGVKLIRSAYSTIVRGRTPAPLRFSTAAAMPWRSPN